MTENFLAQFSETEEVKSKVVVRLSTSAYSDARGLHFKKSLTFLRRKCKGYNFLEEDCSNIGMEDVICKVTNLLEVKDGIYEVVTHNEYRDFETGYVEDYDYYLIEYSEDT